MRIMWVCVCVCISVWQNCNKVFLIIKKRKNLFQGRKRIRSGGDTKMEGNKNKESQDIYKKKVFKKYDYFGK